MTLLNFIVLVSNIKLLEETRYKVPTMQRYEIIMTIRLW